MALKTFDELQTIDRPTGKPLASLLADVVDHLTGAPVTTYDLDGNVAPVISNRWGVTPSFRADCDVARMTIGSSVYVMTNLEASIGLRDSAAAAQTAAEQAQADAATSARSAQDAANLVGAPASTAIDTHLGGDATGLVPAVAGKVGKGDLVINVKDYGAKGDGVTDDSAAITAAIATLGGGGTLFFPRGTYNHTGVNLTSTVAVRVVGASGGHASGSATKGTVLNYTGSGTGTAIDASGSQGLSIEDLSITHSSASFTGNLLKLGGSARFWSIARCQLGGGSGARETATSLHLDGAIEGTVTATKFVYQKVAVSGADSAGAGYSVTVRFRGCSFSRSNVGHIRNGGDGWTFQGCSFSSMTSGEAGAYAGHAGTARPSGVSFLGCWFGDITAGSRPQIEVNGDGFVVAGCQMNVWNGPGLRYMVAGINGVTVTGNKFSGNGAGSIVDFNGQSSAGPATLAPNSWSGLNPLFVGNIPAGSLYNNGTGMNLQGVTVNQPAGGGAVQVWNLNTGQKAVDIAANGNLNVYNPADGALRWRLFAGGILASGVTSKVGTETNDQFEVHTNNTRRTYWTASGTLVHTTGFLHTGTTLGFFNAGGVTKPTVSGAKGGNAALASLLSALASLGLITDGSTA